MAAFWAIHGVHHQSDHFNVSIALRHPWFSDTYSAPFYALADVFVMPSRGEGFGYVFLEALASGVPAIGSKHDGGREALLHGELGLLVDPANPAEIIAAVREVLGRRPKREIPPRLEYFSFENFKTRVGRLMETL